MKPVSAGCECTSHDPMDHPGACGHCGAAEDQPCRRGCPVDGIVQAQADEEQYEQERAALAQAIHKAVNSSVQRRTMPFLVGDAERAVTAVISEGWAPRGECEELRELHDLQQARMREATEMWQQEDPEGRARTLPDLGRLLSWLMQRATSPLHEWKCPSCGASTRARMADHSEERGQ